MSFLKGSLQLRYLKILASSQDFKDISKFSHPKLSELFLAGIPSSYEGSAKKIMVIGREPRGWERYSSSGNTMLDYIKGQEEKATEYLLGRLKMRKDEHGCTFHNFIKNISKQENQVGVVWANLFCYSWNEGDCEKSPIYKQIAGLSRELLVAQIDVLRPQYIVLAHGVAPSSIMQRRTIFPIDSCKTLKNIPNFNGIDEKYLWSFDFDWSSNYKVKCFRIHHPSSSSQLSREVRRKLLDYINENS